MREIFNQFDQEIEWNGKTLFVSVIIYTETDEGYYIGDEDTDTIQKLKDGLLDVYAVECEAMWSGITGTDFLSGIIVRNKKEINHIVNDSDIVNNALDELKRKLSRLKQLFT